jgi:hypothetical protein
VTYVWFGGPCGCPLFAPAAVFAGGALEAMIAAPFRAGLGQCDFDMWKDLETPTQADMCMFRAGQLRPKSYNHFLEAYKKSWRALRI